MAIGKMYRRAVKKAGVRKIARNIYKATGLVNPVKKGRLSTSRLFRDVARLKHIINSEKFTKETLAFSDAAVGQVNGNNSGHLLADFTPLPVQGDGFDNRQGNSIKWVSSHYSWLIQRQASNIGRCTVKIQLIKVIGEPFGTLSNILGKFIEPNKWVNTGTIYDPSSDRKPEYFKNYRVLKTHYVNFPEIGYSGQQSSLQKIVNFGIRLPSHHVKWNGNSNTCSQGQVLCLVTVDTGNCSTTTTSTLDSIVNTATSTGLIVNCNRKDYYYDN